MRRLSAPSLALTAFLVAAFLSPLAIARELPDFTVLVRENGAAVVNISTKQAAATVAQTPHSGMTIPDLPPDSPLRELFQHFLGEDGGTDEAPDDAAQSRSLGSGFIISADGYVLTNAHVVESAEEIVVRTNDFREFVATLIGADKRSDIALLKVDGEGLPTVRIGASKNLQVGEWVLAIGSPFGFDSSATAGIVSAMGRSLPTENYVPFIQTDVAINPGNSGGPLFNLDGAVVGVNSQIYSRTGGFMGLSFAIPIDVVMDVVNQLKTNGRVSRGWLGVLIQDVTRELAETFGMTQPRGALVAQVLPNSPALAADLRPGDVILSFNSQDVLISSALPPLVGATPVGKSATLQVLRQGKQQAITVKIEELPDDNQASTDEEPAVDHLANRLGLVVRDLTTDQREQLDDDANGVLVESVVSGSAEQAGLRAGDLILMLNNQQVPNLTSFNKILDTLPSGHPVAVLIQRANSRMFYAIQIPKK
ncbi:DegQ family serine endoprotease [Chromatium okenii]|uniref:DegQ family serine endoprotease n=1 Tax=Chromatium okenii TaxID=61644 RepID=UPI0026ECE309|nr:DegQ family serine endoprotease [Chromatium okenii]MBV5308944.1 DegQ family serine endoprotease [Chromatium okenii]